MARMRVWNRGGLPSRTIPIAGRNAMLPSGRLSMIGSVAERNELDWKAIEAAIGADNVVVEISPIEVDLLSQMMPPLFRCGQNVELSFSKPSFVHIESDGTFGKIVDPPYNCCGIGFMNPLEMGRHRRNDANHRAETAYERAQEQAEAQAPSASGQEHEWLAGTTETK